MANLMPIAAVQKLYPWNRNKNFRVIEDRGHPIRAIISGTGAHEVGFWDVCKAFNLNPSYVLVRIKPEHKRRVPRTLLGMPEGKDMWVISPACMPGIMPSTRRQEILPLKSWLESQPDPSLQAVVPFQFEGKDFIVIEDKQGKPWFVARDVCAVLGYTNGPKAVRDHCKYAKTLKQNDSFGLTSSPNGLLIIPESDLYRLIMRSNMPVAEKFQDWVTEVVLPQIRKTGSYQGKVTTAVAYDIAL